MTIRVTGSEPGEVFPVNATADEDIRDHSVPDPALNDPKEPIQIFPLTHSFVQVAHDIKNPAVASIVWK